MNYSIILTEGSLIFLSLLLIMYFNKQQFKDPRTKLYKSLAISSFVYSIVQIALVLLIKYNLIDNGSLLFYSLVVKWNVT